MRSSLRSNQKLDELIEDTRITSEEYFEAVEFANAYNILVPASNPNKASIKAVLHNSMMPAVIVEALVLIVYLAVAFIMAIKNENSKKLAVNRFHMMTKMKRMTIQAKEIPINRKPEQTLKNLL